jgi:hypothetical protein
MVDRIEVVFRFGSASRRLAASRAADGSLSIRVSNEGQDDWHQSKTIQLAPEETEALCMALNGLGNRVPDMEVPKPERKEACIGFHVDEATEED